MPKVEGRPDRSLLADVRCSFCDRGPTKAEPTTFRAPTIAHNNLCCTHILSLHHARKLQGRENLGITNRLQRVGTTAYDRKVEEVTCTPKKGRSDKNFVTKLDLSA